ncbi:MAG: alkaline phosphatase family protein [Thermodesulfobacteriota bacterium]
MTSKGKVAVFGLDGVPYSLLQELFTAGVMPELAEVARTGSFQRMETDLPPVSSVAWTSFMTGANPGRHGIFGFTDLDENRALKLPSFDDIRCPTVWHKTPQARFLIINLPFTYPARPLDGVLISGFVAPAFERAVYPESLIPWLRSLDYRIDVDSVRGRTDRRGLILELFEHVNTLEKVTLSLAESHPWELCIVVVTGTDRLHHFFFDAATDTGNPFHQDFIDYYGRVDRFFGRFRDSVARSARLIALSDHGFTRLKTQVYVNHLLHSMGYLELAFSRAKEPSDLQPRTRAFALDPGRIYINSRDRFKAGAVSPDEKRALCIKLRGELTQVRLRDIGLRSFDDDDSPDDWLFDAVLAAEEIYHGECLRFAPDLVLVPRRGYDLKAALDVHVPSGKDIFTGTHTHDDAFLISDDPSLPERLPRPRIRDVARLMEQYSL